MLKFQSLVMLNPSVHLTTSSVKIMTLPMVWKIVGGLVFVYCVTLVLLKLHGGGSGKCFIINQSNYDSIMELGN